MKIILNKWNAIIHKKQPWEFILRQFLCYGDEENGYDNCGQKQLIMCKLY